MSASKGDVIDLPRRNVSHAFMELPTQLKPMPKLIAAMVVVSTLISLVSQATGQQAQPGHQRRHAHTPDMPSGDNPYQVWLGIDIWRYWTPQEMAGIFSAQFPRLHQHADIAGAWSTAELPGLVLTLQLNGTFSLATTGNPEKRCSSGVERGNWALPQQTNELLFHIKTDTNGRCGFSDMSAPITIHRTATGLSAFTDDQPARGRRELPLVRR